MTEHAMTDEELSALGLATIVAIPDAVIYCDPKGRIRFWNEGAERIFGHSADEAIGQSLDIIIPQRLRKRHWDGFFAMMKTGQSRYGPSELLCVPAMTRSGATISIQFTAAATTDAAGKVTGIVSILRDETETYEELRRLRMAVDGSKG